MRIVYRIPLFLRTVTWCTLIHLGCAEKPTIDELVQTNISGRVLNKKDNSAIVGASVRTQPPTTTITTDKQGRFLIEIPGFELTADYTIIVVAEGFLTAEVVTKVVAGRDNPVDIVLELIEPELQVKDDLIRFDLGDNTKFLRILNVGNALLEWEVQLTEISWLEVLYDDEPQQGSFEGSTPAGQESVLKLTVDREQAENKELFKTSIYVRPTTGGEGTEVAIEMVKELLPTRILGNVTNGGNSSAIEGASVSTQPVTTSITTDVEGGFIIEVQGLEGSVEYTIVVAAAGFVTSEKTIQLNVGQDTVVDILMDPVGELNVSPGALSFGTERSKLNLQVENGGHGDLHWMVSKAPAWIAIRPDSGSIAAGAPGTRLSIDADRTTLRGGEHSGIIEIRSQEGDQSAAVTVTIFVEEPTISIAARTIQFGTTKNEVTFDINNIGLGDLDWRFEDIPTWLKVEPQTGTTSINPSTVTLVLNRTGQPIGEISSSIKLISNSLQDSEIELKISASVIAAPRLSVGSPQLEFGENRDRLSFEITNSNNGTLEWRVAEDLDWMVVEPSEGDLGLGEAVVINAEVNRSALLADDYEGEIVISSNGGQTSVNVQMVVAQAPDLAVSPVEINFGDSLTEAVLQIANKGTGMLSWTVTAEVSWLDVDTEKGQTLAETDRITLKVRRADLLAGSYSVPVTIESDGGSVSINVSMEVGAFKQLTVTPQGLDFLSDQDQLSVTLENSGNFAVAAEVVASVDWLRVEPTQPTIAIDPGQSVEIVVIVDRTSLAIGRQEGSLQISDGEEEFFIPVSVHVERAILGGIAEPLVLGSESAVGQLEISNDGNIPLEWTASLQPVLTAIALKSGSGTIQPDETVQLVVEADTSGLDAGTYETTLKVESNGGGISVAIIFRVGERPALFLSPESLQLGLYESSATITLTNGGNVALSWQIESPAWVQVVPDKGLIELGDSQEVAVELDRSDLAVGDHSGEITVTSSQAGAQSLLIDIRVPGEVFAVFPRSLGLAEGQGKASLMLSNTGNIGLSWVVDTATLPAWLELDLVQGSLEPNEEVEVLVRALRTGLKPKKYTTELSFVSGDSALAVTVEMDVGEEPILSVSATELDLGAELSSMALSMSNTGNAPLSWTIDSLPDWLTVTSAVGVLVAGAEVELTLSVDRDRVAPGSYSQIVLLRSDGGEHQISVSVKIQRPMLVLSQDAVALTDETPVKFISIANPGNEILEWEFTKAADWLTISPPSGVVEPGGIQVVEFKIFASTIDAGAYDVSLQLRSNAGNAEIVASAISSGQMSVYVLFEATDLAIQDGADTGDVIDLQLHVSRAPALSGWSAQFEYSEEQFEFLEFIPSDFIAEFNQLEDRGLSNQVTVGGIVLDSEAHGIGDGLLGTVKFVVQEGLVNSGELRLTKFSYRPPSGGEVFLAEVDISAEVVREVAGN